MDATKQFPQFAKLPSEIRLMIWRQCLPFRVCEIDIPGPRERPVRCILEWSQTRNVLPPVIAHVCRESRSVALEFRSEEECLLLYNQHPFNGRWFSPRLSVAFMHWKPVDTMILTWTLDMIPCLEWYADRCCAAAIDASFMHYFYIEDGYAKWTNPLLDTIAKRKDYLVCVETIIIHASREAAAQSGLFGLLVDAPVQLIDATDTERFAQFQDLWATNPRRDMTPDGFFRDQESFQSRLARWREELVALWVYNEWYKAYKDGWRGVIEPEKIWIGPRYDEFGFERDMLLPGCVCSDEDPKDLDYDLFSPNFDHPFVQQALAVMPRFQPRVLFRLCPLDCHLHGARY